MRESFIYKSYKTFYLITNYTLQIKLGINGTFYKTFSLYIVIAKRSLCCLFLELQIGSKRPKSRISRKAWVVNNTINDSGDKSIFLCNFYKRLFKFILPIFSTTAMSWKSKFQQQELSLVKVLSRLIKKGNSNIRYYYNQSRVIYN